MTMYEGMFLLDNKAMGEDWGASLDQVVDLVTKSGGTVASARRWDERKLAYKVNGRQRGTYVLTYFDADGAGVAALATEVRLSPMVMRHVVLGCEAAPEEELEVGIQREIPEPEPEPEPESPAEGETADKEAAPDATADADEEPAAEEEEVVS